MKLPKEVFYVPNIISYIRFLILIMFVMIETPLYQVLLVMSTMPLDILDGMIARKWNQTSVFGARLDLAVDIISHSVITFYVGYHLSNLFMRDLLFFFSINEIVSHAPILFYMYGANSGKTGHKSILMNSGYLLSFYYTNTGLFLLNMLHGCFLVLNILHVEIYSIIYIICFVGYLTRQLCLFEQAYFFYFKRDLLKA